MHKGKYGPKNPDFWKGQALWTPAYAPWKINWYAGGWWIEGAGRIGTPPFPVISQGSEVIDEHTIQWTTPITWPATSTKFVLTLSDFTYLHKHWLTYAALLFDGDELIQGCYQHEPSPVLQFGIDPTAYWYHGPEFPPDSIYPTGQFGITLASWAQAGSPWSNAGH